MNSVKEMCSAVTAPKRILSFPIWKHVNDVLRLTASMEADGVVMQGLTFMAQCNPELPDERVFLGILAEIKRKPRCIARVDWRALGHGNSHRLCGEHRFLDAGRTHFHDPELHHGFDFAELFDGKNDLPVALPIQPEPATFNDLLARAADLLHIQNLTDMPVPRWEPRTSFI